MLWRPRARALSLKQCTIAEFLGVSDSTISRALDGEDPQAIKSIITGWSLMTPAQRKDWMQLAGVRDRRVRQRVFSKAAAAIALIASGFVTLLFRSAEIFL